MDAMGFNFNFFGTPEHRVFRYRPRYYDEEKEALKEKFGHVDGSRKNDTYVPGSYIKGSLRNGNYQRTKQAGKSMAIVGVIGLVLFFIALVLFAKYFTLLW